MSEYASRIEYRDLARAMGWHMSINAHVTLSKPGRRTILVHYATDVSIVKALTMAAEADQGAREVRV